MDIYSCTGKLFRITYPKTDERKPFQLKMPFNIPPHAGAFNITKDNIKSHKKVLKFVKKNYFRLLYNSEREKNFYCFVEILNVEFVLTMESSTIKIFEIDR